MNPPPDFNTTEWLGSIGLGHLAPLFEQNQITYETLAELTNEDLVECGVEALGHRKKLLAEIRNLMAAAASPPAVVEVPVVSPPDTVPLAVASPEPEQAPPPVISLQAAALPAAERARVAETPQAAHSVRLQSAAVVDAGSAEHPHSIDEIRRLAHQQDEYLKQRQRRSVITSLIIALLTIVLIMLVLALFLLPALLVETPEFVTYEASKTATEEQEVKKVRTSTEVKPASPASSMARVIAANTTSATGVPVPDLAVDTPSLDFGDSEEFGEGWGDGGLDGGSGGEISFFGLKKKPKSIVFVFDISGSMVVPPKSSKTYQALEAEILNTISSLAADVPFGLVAFSKEADSYRSKLVTSTLNERTTAMSWLKSMDPSGGVAGGRRTYNTKYRNGRHSGTRADLALAAAMKLSPETIIFVSDGEPTDAKGKSSKGLNEAILKKVAAMQNGREPKAQINVVAYMAGGGKEFMRQLAKQNGGDFREIRPAGAGKK